MRCRQYRTLHKDLMLAQSMEILCSEITKSCMQLKQITLQFRFTGEDLTPAWHIPHQHLVIRSLKTVYRKLNPMKPSMKMSINTRETPEELTVTCWYKTHITCTLAMSYSQYRHSIYACNPRRSHIYTSIKPSERLCPGKNTRHMASNFILRLKALIQPWTSDRK